MYELYDTFNKRVVSRHRTLDAAVKADRRLQRAVKRGNGQSSYLPTEYHKDGERLTDDEYEIALCLTQKHW